MAGAQHFRVVYRSALCAIGDYRCRARNAAPGIEEVATDHSVVFSRSGLFVRHTGRQETVADPNHVMFFNSGDPYRISHPVAGGDDCTVFMPDPNVLAELIGAYEPDVADRPERPFSMALTPSNARVYLLHRRLLQHLDGGAPDTTAVDEVVLDLLAHLLGDAFGRRGQRAQSVRAGTRRSHRDTVAATKAVLTARSAERLPLNDIARGVHCSPYHLSRLFRHETGLPIHRYFNRLRLRRALERLAEGAPDLTALALAVGFSSHAHFSDAFRREFGHRPSQLRRRPAPDLLRQMSKNLKA
ncbi:MAG: helix-turn-helix transcriptional regulator [bacterium]|nr:helix-turn-helix transcriptional regulator [bacterium]